MCACVHIRVCMCVCVCEVIVGTLLQLSELPLALCSSVQPELLILFLKRSHFLWQPLPVSVQRCWSLCVCVFKSIILINKRIFSHKAEAKASMSVVLIRSHHMRGQTKRARRTLGWRSLMCPLGHSLLASGSQTYAQARHWLMSCCDADICKGKASKDWGELEGEEETKIMAQWQQLSVLHNFRKLRITLCLCFHGCIVQV